MGITILMELREGEYLTHILETSDYIMWFEFYYTSKFQLHISM